MYSAFKLKGDEDAVSCNLLDYYDENDDVRYQLKCIYDAHVRTINRNGKFAILNVGEVQNNIKNLIIEHNFDEENPEKNPSHASIKYPPGNENNAFEMKLVKLLKKDDEIPINEIIEYSV